MMAKESTTPDLVELVDGAFEAVNRSDLDGLMRFYAPDALVDMTRTVGVALQGRAALRGVVEDWMAAYEEMEWAHDEPLDLRNGVLFAVVRQKGRPVGTTGYVQQREGWVWVWADGLIVSHTIYQDIDEARAAAERIAEERGQGA
jgi:ketosteroid isomerase-like protein